MNDELTMLSGETDDNGGRSGVMTVSELNGYVKALIESDGVLSNIYVKGEISNFKKHTSGHYYFSLKDDGGVLRAVMFRSAAMKMRFEPENGMKVVARGRISVFVRDGQYQLYAEALEPDGVGSLYVAFEQLKRRLEAEGLFAPSRKRPLPKIPKRVGIVTSPTGAAVRDMINISARRFPAAELIIYPALVQGPDAPADIVAGLRYFNEKSRVDVIIIGRGGGSIEDLWAFNDEGVARAVAASKLPVISAVGHETDFTIADFAADVRAPTPSAAAELALPETNELKQRLTALISRERLLFEQRIAAYRAKTASLSSSRFLRDPRVFIDDRRLTAASLSDKLTAAETAAVNRGRLRLASSAAKLDALSPMAVIARGYSAVFDGGGALIKSVGQLSEGDEVGFRLADGEADAKIIKIKSKDA